jgi:phosphotransferase family enzyme
MYRGAMPSTHTEHALVPDATRQRVLVIATDGTRPSLPSWTLIDPEAVDSIREARRLFGIDSPFLRVLRIEGDFFHGEPADTLLEFDAVPATWEAPEGSRWLPISDIGRLALGSAPFAPALARWREELRTGDIPPRRPAWARPGWHDATADWLTGELDRLGLSATGPVEQLGSWAISSLLAVDTSGGRVVLKSVPAIFGHEPQLTRALAAEHPRAIPDVLAIDPEGGHLLMSAFGGAPLGREDASRWADGLRPLAAIQGAWIGRRAEAEAIGVDDRTLAALDAEVDSIVTDAAASPGLPDERRERLVERLPEFHALNRELQAGPVPETLVHGDFHPWNVQRDGDRLVMFDWSDACWGHPFFDVATFTQRTDDEAARDAMRGAYVEAWADHAEEPVLRDALAKAELLTELHLSITWRRLSAVFEADGAYPFVDAGVQRHLELALAAVEGRA